MFSKIPALQLAKKAVAATVVCGAVALGTGGVAFAATTTTSGATPATHPHRCARATKALTRIDKVESAINGRVTKLQAAETKATGAGHTKLAARIEKRITHLQTADTKAGNLASKIEAKCPGTSSS